MQLMTPGDLARLQRFWDEGQRSHPLSDSPWLLLDVRDSGEALPERADFLRGLPCPVIALADERATPTNLQLAADCVVYEEAGFEVLLRNIRRAPLAAMTLVQLSRAIEALPLAAALDMESLAYATLQTGPEYRAWLERREPVEAGLSEALDDPPVLMTRQGNQVTLTLNRPDNRNAVSLEVRDALVEALQMVVADDSIERLVLDGAGKCFCVGGDLSEFGQVPDAATGHLVRSLRLPGRWLARCAERTEARVHGACIGAGVELPAFAGRFVADERSHFQLPELAMGLIPGAGGCVSIARRIGRQRFNWLALSGKRINVRTAATWGLVDEVMAS